MHFIDLLVVYFDLGQAADVLKKEMDHDVLALKEQFLAFEIGLSRVVEKANCEEQYNQGWNNKPWVNQTYIDNCNKGRNRTFNSFSQSKE